MDVRLVSRKSRVGVGEAVLRSAQSARRQRAAEHGSLDAADQDSAKGAEGRLTSLLAELLSALSSRGAFPRTDRHVHVTRRLPLHRSTAEMIDLRHPALGAGCPTITCAARARRDRRFPTA